MTDHAASSAARAKVNTTQPGRSGCKVRRNHASNKRDGCNGNNPLQNGPGSADGTGGSKTKKTGELELEHAAPISSVPPPSLGTSPSSSLKQRPPLSVGSCVETGRGASRRPAAVGRDEITAEHRSSHHLKSDVKTLATGSCADQITQAAVHKTTTPGSRASLDPCDGLKRDSNQQGILCLSRTRGHEASQQADSAENGQWSDASGGPHARSSTTTARGCKQHQQHQQQQLQKQQEKKQRQPKKHGSKKQTPKNQHQQEQHLQKQQEEPKHEAQAVGTSKASIPPHTPDHPRGKEERTEPARTVKGLEFHELSPATSTDYEERSPFPEKGAGGRKNGDAGVDSIDSLCSSLLEILAESEDVSSKAELATLTLGGRMKFLPTGKPLLEETTPTTSAVSSTSSSANSRKSDLSPAGSILPTPQKLVDHGQRDREKKRTRNRKKEEKKDNDGGGGGGSLVLDSVDVAGDIAQWAADNSRGGEFTKVLEAVRRDSGVVSVDTRAVLKQGAEARGKGARAQIDKVHVDIRAATPAQARMARALLQTHFKSRSELLRLEHAQRSMEGSLSAFEREVSQGLRVQFASRPEWIGLLVGKAGSRIRGLRKSTGCSIEVIDGGGGGGRGGPDGSWGGGGGGGGGGQKAAGGQPPAASSCRVVICGPDAGSVQRAREQMELTEGRIAVNPQQAAVLGRLPRTKLLGIRQQSQCMVVDLQSGSACHGRQQQQQQNAPPTKNNYSSSGAVTRVMSVRVIGPRSTVDSARLLLGVVLEYMDRERELREGDNVVREKLLDMHASFGHPGTARPAAWAAKAGRGGYGRRAPPPGTSPNSTDKNREANQREN
ncbi:unnamed protein product [Ectocarpus sp. 4 AP-2014]